MKFDGRLLQDAGYADKQSELLLSDSPTPQANVAKHDSYVLIGLQTCCHCTRVCPQFEMRLCSRANWFELGRFDNAIAPSGRRIRGIFTCFAARTENIHRQWCKHKGENVRHRLLPNRYEWFARALDSFSTDISCTHCWTEQRIPVRTYLFIRPDCSNLDDRRLCMYVCMY